MSLLVTLVSNSRESIQQALNKLADQVQQAIGSISGGGHTIIVNGTAMPQEPALYFKGPEGQDEPIDGWTILTFPRSVTTADRLTIPVFNGLTVFDTDLNRLMRYNTNAWETA